MSYNGEIKQRQGLLDESNVKGRFACSTLELIALSLFAFVCGGALVFMIMHFQEVPALTESMNSLHLRKNLARVEFQVGDGQDAVYIMQLAFNLPNDTLALEEAAIMDGLTTTLDVDTAVYVFLEAVEYEGDGMMAYAITGPQSALDTIETNMKADTFNNDVSDAIMASSEYKNNFPFQPEVNTALFDTNGNQIEANTDYNSASAVFSSMFIVLLALFAM